MFTLAKNTAKLLIPYSKRIAKDIAHVSFSNGAQRSAFGNILGNSQLGTRSTKLANAIRQSGSSSTASAQISSNAGTKGQKVVGYWLLTCGGMVFVDIVLGTVTRSSHSNLPMVTCKMYGTKCGEKCDKKCGRKMPRSEEEWLTAFKKFQQFPEYKMANKEMTFSEFKRLWCMEIGHNLWKAATGAVFLIPAAIFWSKGFFNKGLKTRVPMYGVLFLVKGLLGCSMVKFSFKNHIDDKSDTPKISPYRLISHAGVSIFLYSSFLWSALHNLLPADTISSTSREIVKSAAKFRILALNTKGLIFFTALAGVFVAGTDTNLVRHSLSRKEDTENADDTLMILQPKPSNVPENPTNAQLTHRILGVTTWAVISGLWLISQKRTLPRRAHTAATALGVMASVQTILGVSTLLLEMPTSLLASHQSGSLVLFSIAMWLAHELKKLPK